MSDILASCTFSTQMFLHRHLVYTVRNLITSSNFCYNFLCELIIIDLINNISCYLNFHDNACHNYIIHYFEECMTRILFEIPRLPPLVSTWTGHYFYICGIHIGPLREICPANSAKLFSTFRLFNGTGEEDSNYRRRINTEEKAKVVATVLGTELIQFLAKAS